MGRLFDVRSVGMALMGLLTFYEHYAVVTAQNAFFSNK